MKHTATLAMSTMGTMDQHIRNQMSLMAWGMAFLCGWVLFLSVHARGANLDSDATVSAAPTGQLSSAPQ